VTMPAHPCHGRAPPSGDGIIPGTLPRHTARIAAAGLRNCQPVPSIADLRPLSAQLKPVVPDQLDCLTQHRQFLRMVHPERRSRSWRRGRLANSRGAHEWLGNEWQASRARVTLRDWRNAGKRSTDVWARLRPRLPGVILETVGPWRQPPHRPGIRA
jgi:hypothetical protein